jgi:hypothetical protein
MPVSDLHRQIAAVALADAAGHAKEHVTRTDADSAGNVRSRP